MGARRTQGLIEHPDQPHDARLRELQDAEASAVVAEETLAQAREDVAKAALALAAETAAAGAASLLSRTANRALGEARNREALAEESWRLHCHILAQARAELDGVAAPPRRAPLGSRERITARNAEGGAPWRSLGPRAPRLRRA